jgi:hypothetical protein
MIRNLVENFKVVSGTTPVTTNGAVTGDYVSLKNCNKAWIVVKLTQAAAHATVLSPKQATAVDGTGVKVFANTLKINANEDVSASDTLAAQTAAVNYTVTADIANKVVVFEIDPADLDTANDFDCITISSSASSEATNFIDVTYYLDMKYKEDVPPAVITD